VVSHDVGLLTVWKTANLISNPAPEPIQALGGILLSFNSSGFSSDGSRLLGCSPGPETIKIWDTVSYHDLLTLMVEDATPRGARLSPDGHYLAAWDGGRVFLWQAASWDEIQQAENLEKKRLATR
jgi:WD40 repeat protein